MSLPPFMNDSVTKSNHMTFMHFIPATTRPCHSESHVVGDAKPEGSNKGSWIPDRARLPGMTRHGVVVISAQAEKGVRHGPEILFLSSGAMNLRLRPFAALRVTALVYQFFCGLIELAPGVTWRLFVYMRIERMHHGVS